MRSQDTITFTGSTTGDTGVGEVTIPRQLGPVQLLREIGRGGMGVVYLGRHQMLDRDVAVKFLLNAVAGPDDPGFARFLEGARAAARLEHPGLTTIHHADVIDGIPYLVMQYIDGPALSEVLKQTGPLSLSAWFAVLDAVSESIGELHDRGIIHRDIKPSNVLLSRDGRVVVTDFGLAVAHSLGQRGPSAARLGGTLAYMAPEMFTGEVSSRTDVYALGITAFNLLTGELPFTGIPEDVREKHLHEPLPLEPLQQRRLDPGMIDVLERATHKNAMFRYKTAGHFRKALKPGIMTDELLREGVVDLQKLGTRSFEEESHVATIEAGEHTPTSTYFDRLSEVAAEKRDAREPTHEATLERAAHEDRDQGRLTDDLLCIRCGYSLRGLQEGSRCPECGTAITQSLRGDLLSAADSAWLQRVYRGQALVCAGCVVLLSHFILYNVSGSRGSLATWVIVNTLGASSTVYAVSEAVISGAVILLLLLGVFATTTLDPRLSLTEQPIALRRFVRGNIVALVALAGSSYLVPTVVQQLRADAEVAGLCGTVLLYASGLAFLSSLVGICYYLAGLAMRIPVSELATRTRSKVVRFVVCFGILWVASQVLEYAEGVLAGTLGPPVIACFLILVVAVIGYLVSLMVLMSAYRKAFRKALVEAHKHAAV